MGRPGWGTTATGLPVRVPARNAKPTMYMTRTGCLTQFLTNGARKRKMMSATAMTDTMVAICCVSKWRSPRMKGVSSEKLISANTAKDSPSIMLR